MVCEKHEVMEWYFVEVSFIQQGKQKEPKICTISVLYLYVFFLKFLKSFTFMFIEESTFPFLLSQR